MINTQNGIKYISLDEIRPNPYQARKSFERVKLNELAESIKEYGVIQPIVVRCINNSGYELVVGERRLKAARMAGIEVIPAIVVSTNDKDSSIMALIENIHRQKLNFFEEAEGYRNIMRDYNITQEELSKKIGKSQSGIANKMRILRLPASVKNKIIDGELSERHARALLRVNDERIQLEIINKVIIQGLNVKRTEEVVDYYVNKILKDELPVFEQKNKIGIKDIRIFTNTVRQAVEAMNKLGVDVKYLFEEKKNFYEIKINIPNLK